MTEFAGLSSCGLDELAGREVRAAILGFDHGSPYVSGQSSHAAGAATAIRAASMVFAKQLHQHDFDTGAVLLPKDAAASAGTMADVGTLPTDPMDAAGNRATITAAVRQVLAAGAVPIVLGGDDSVPIPVFQAYEGRGPLTMLQIDAHVDWGDNVRGNPFGYGSPMRRASEMPWIKGMVQVGMRGLGSGTPDQLADARAWGAHLVPARALRRQGCEAALALIPEDADVMLSIDCDGLDPAVLPAVNMPTPGGLDMGELTELLQGVAARGRIVGCCLVELVPGRDTSGLSALVAARIVLTVLGLVMARERRVGNRLLGQAVPERATAPESAAILDTLPAHRADLPADAYAAMQRGQWQAALELWTTLRAQDAGDAEALNGVAASLMALGRRAEANALLDRGVEAHPGHIAMAYTHAWAAHHLVDKGLALERWTQLRARFPQEMLPFTEAARLLDVECRFDEAAALIAQGVEAFPESTDVRAVQAMVAMHRRDWTLAQQAWRRVREVSPADAPAWVGEIEALRGLGRVADLRERLQAATAAFPDNEQVQAIARTLERHDLVLRFQNLGENCEFGLLQREVYAEPISLLRWGAITPGALIDALDHDFAGVGDVAQTVMSPIKDEYFTNDRRYGMSMHTHIPATRDQDKTFAAITGRLRYLVGEQLAALREATHVFIYQTAAPMRDADMLGVFRALRRHGPGSLLCVRVADTANPCGHVRVVEPGLVFGYLDRLGPQREADGHAWAISPHWFDLCQTALHLLTPNTEPPA